MKVYVYQLPGLKFKWDYFEECTKVQDMFSSQLVSCDTIEEAEIAFFPLELGTAFQHQRSPHDLLSTHPNLQYMWRTHWSKLIRCADTVKHFVLLSYVLYNVNVSFIPKNFTILAYESEVTLDIHGTRGNFGCQNRIVTIPYYVDVPALISIAKNPEERQHKIVFVGSLKHACKFRNAIIPIVKPVCFEPTKDLNYLDIYENSLTALVLRGDTPTRCAFYQCIQTGCMPIIFKHCFLHYKNLYGGILPIEDLCLVIPDFDFDVKPSVSYEMEIMRIINDFINDTTKQKEFQQLANKHKHTLNYNFKMSNGLSAPIFYALEAIHNPQPNKCHEPIVFIVNLEPKYNLDLLPVEISSMDKVEGKETSQYELEIHWHRQMKHFLTTSVIESANFVFIPFYMFLSGWKNKVFDTKKIVAHVNDLIANILSWKSMPHLPHFLVYSDVSWPKSFMDDVNWPKNTVLISMESIQLPNIKTITSPYMSGFNQLVNNQNKPKSQLLSYIGRMRLPFVNNKSSSSYPKCKFTFIEMAGWKSINQQSFLQECSEMYTNSVFSLQPPGDRHTRRGFFQSLLHSCIPVIFQDNVLGYQQHLIESIDIQDICIVIPRDVAQCTIEFVIGFLENVSQDKIEKIKTTIESIKDNYLFHEFHSKPVINIVKQLK